MVQCRTGWCGSRSYLHAERLCEETAATTQLQMYSSQVYKTLPLKYDFEMSGVVTVVTIVLKNVFHVKPNIISLLPLILDNSEWDCTPTRWSYLHLHTWLSASFARSVEAMKPLRQHTNKEAFIVPCSIETTLWNLQPSSEVCELTSLSCRLRNKLWQVERFPPDLHCQLNHLHLIPILQTKV